MCKFTKVVKMLKENNVNNFTVQNGEMEVHTEKHYIYMEKVTNGIKVKVRLNEMFSYFVDILVKNQNDAIGHIIGFIINSWNQEETQEPTQAIKKVACEVEPTVKEEEKNNFKSDLMGDINVCYELLKLEGIALGIDTLSLKGVKWNDLFCTEKDLLRALYQMDLDCYKENGQYYIQGFQKQLHNGEMLSPKQLTQLKRMARFICLHYLRDTFHKYNGKKLLKPKTK